MSKTVVYKKWDVVLASLDHTIGAEISKTRPVLIVSPSAVNNYMNTVTIIPFTSQPMGYPFRLTTNFDGKIGELCEVQIKSIDKSRFVKRKLPLDKNYHNSVRLLISEYFRE